VVVKSALPSHAINTKRQNTKGGGKVKVVMRLTEKNCELENDKLNKIYQKLGQLEDIEDEFCVYDNEDLRRRLDLADKYGELSEQIGIDLITLFKAMKNGYWFNEKSLFITGEELESFKLHNPSNFDDETGLFYQNGVNWNEENVIYQAPFLSLTTIDNKAEFYLGSSFAAVLLKDYGKTWALTKEELL